jgi:hypothetical protein
LSSTIRGNNNFGSSDTICAIATSASSTIAKSPQWLQSTLAKFNKVFEPPIATGLPVHRQVEHEIRLREGVKIPPVCPHRFSPKDREILNGEVSALLARGLIRPSKSEFSASAFIARSEGRKDRMVIDYRALNSITIKDKFPLPHLEDMLQAVSNSVFFSKLDLKSGFHQIRMEEASIHLTSFKTPTGTYEWLVMPFGLTNSPSTFQRTMNEVLAPFLNKFVVVYIDDILVFSKTKEDHQQHVIPARNPGNCLRKNRMHSENKGKQECIQRGYLYPF